MQAPNSKSLVIVLLAIVVASYIPSWKARRGMSENHEEDSLRRTVVDNDVFLLASPRVSSGKRDISSAILDEEMNTRLTLNRSLTFAWTTHTTSCWWKEQTSAGSVLELEHEALKTTLQGKSSTRSGALLSALHLGLAAQRRSMSNQDGSMFQRALDPTALNHFFENNAKDMQQETEPTPSTDGVPTNVAITLDVQISKASVPKPTVSVKKLAVDKLAAAIWELGPMKLTTDHHGKIQLTKDEFMYVMTRIAMALDRVRIGMTGKDLFDKHKTAASTISVDGFASALAEMQAGRSCPCLTLEEFRMVMQVLCNDMTGVSMFMLLDDDRDGYLSAEDILAAAGKVKRQEPEMKFIKPLLYDMQGKLIEGPDGLDRAKDLFLKLGSNQSDPVCFCSFIQESEMGSGSMMTILQARLWAMEGFDAVAKDGYATVADLHKAFSQELDAMKLLLELANATLKLNREQFYFVLNDREFLDREGAGDHEKTHLKHVIDLIMQFNTYDADHDGILGENDLANGPKAAEIEKQTGELAVKAAVEILMSRGDAGMMIDPFRGVAIVQLPPEYVKDGRPDETKLADLAKKEVPEEARKEFGLDDGKSGYGFDEWSETMMYAIKRRTLLNKARDFDLHHAQAIKKHHFNRSAPTSGSVSSSNV